MHVRGRGLLRELKSNKINDFKGAAFQKRVWCVFGSLGCHLGPCEFVMFCVCLYVSAPCVFLSHCAQSVELLQNPGHGVVKMKNCRKSWAWACSKCRTVVKLGSGNAQNVELP